MLILGVDVHFRTLCCGAGVSLVFVHLDPPTGPTLLSREPPLPDPGTVYSSPSPGPHCFGEASAESGPPGTPW